MNIKTAVTTFSLFVSIFAIAQETKSGLETFVPNGKPIVKVYSNFSVTNSNHMSNSGFELQRAYFGYCYNFSKEISGKVVFDVANSSGLAPSSFTAFLKNAYTEYSKESLTVDFGLIGTTNYKLQENIWGKRYLYKSLQDEYGFQSSADLGASITYDVLPQLSFDIAVFNGEGYKKIQADSTVQFALGLTVQPIKNLYIRVYGDYMKSEVAQKTYNAFAGYKTEKLALGAEYNFQQANKMMEDHDFSGISVYGTYCVAKKVSIFGRFDNVKSDKIGAATSGWNSADAKVYFAGIEYQPVKGIKITPNMQFFDKEVGYSAKTYIINVEMSL